MLGVGGVVFNVATEANYEVVHDTCVGIFMDAPDRKSVV
jgi:hypothetical protein